MNNKKEKNPKYLTAKEAIALVKADAERMKKEQIESIRKEIEDVDPCQTCDKESNKKIYCYYDDETCILFTFAQNIEDACKKFAEKLKKLYSEYDDFNTLIKKQRLHSERFLEITKGDNNINPDLLKKIEYEKTVDTLEKFLKSYVYEMNADIFGVGFKTRNVIGLCDE